MPFSAADRTFDAFVDPESVPGVEFPPRLLLDDAVDRDGAVADQLLRLSARAGEADQLERLGQRDGFTFNEEEGGGRVHDYRKILVSVFCDFPDILSIWR